ncbi:PepSY domain-containing protein [Mesorhizobium sp. YM1C-6-2]|uniref:PepSY domain-containing protein n=1 Tax=Mesorhizobium sp. YM1C-6-2 TaxID=1827501 RepID=UPI000EF24BAD|nr:PepSY domain-containing protein [Mesorhizobium sp. YM1C-6-2]RLP28216.1 PepSY domain-containing protein [Mesorhizobium sp. YM1C-6-2]
MRPLLLTLAAAAALLASPALADRAPTPEERAAIEAKLRAEGFTRWESIELEDDESVWEVDDAVAADGREYDLDLEPGTLEILKRDPD